MRHTARIQMLKQNVLQNSPVSLTFFKSTSGHINKFRLCKYSTIRGQSILNRNQIELQYTLTCMGLWARKRKRRGKKNKKKHADAQRKRRARISSASYMTALGRYWQALKAVWSEQQVVFYKWQD